MTSQVWTSDDAFERHTANIEQLQAGAEAVEDEVLASMMQAARIDNDPMQEVRNLLRVLLLMLIFARRFCDWVMRVQSASFLFCA